MKKWEYYIVRQDQEHGVIKGNYFVITLEDGTTYPVDERKNIFSQLGEKGWELVTTTEFTGSYGTISVLYFFKRELKNK